MIKDVQDRFHMSTKTTQTFKSPESSHPLKASEKQLIQIPHYQPNQNMQTSYKPVIIVGTKMDKLNEEEDLSKYTPLIESFPFVLVGLTCSANWLHDVDEVFHHSQQSVTSPLHPLYDVNMREFTVACRRAFQRIFRIFDVDNDNLLNDVELCELQFQWFGTNVNAEELIAMKRFISKTVPGGLQKKCFTFEGLLGCIEKFWVNNNNTEASWALLRYFNYDDQLQLMARYHKYS